MFFLRLSPRFKNCFSAFFRLLRQVFSPCAPRTSVFRRRHFPFLKRIVFRDRLFAAGSPRSSCEKVSFFYDFIHNASIDVLPAFFAGYRRFLEQPSLFSTLIGCAGLIVYRPMLGGTAVFSSGLFRRWSPDVNFDKFTTCFPTFCRAPRSCYSDVFAEIFFVHDALFVSRCASSRCILFIFDGFVLDVLQRDCYRFLRPPPIQVYRLFRQQPSFCVYLRLALLGSLRRFSSDAYFNSKEIKIFSSSRLRFWKISLTIFYVFNSPLGN